MGMKSLEQYRADFIDKIKNTMATNLTNKGVSASRTESLQSLADKIANVITGKKWASGTVTSSTSTSTFYLTSGGSGYYSTVIVNGLTFKPSFILIKQFDDSNITVYDNRLAVSYRISMVYNKSSSPGAVSIQETSPVSITSTEFLLPVPSGNISYNWIAFE